ncbi:DUF2935 domain-containing protein [Ornithinibacillus halotolerans]|uniref:DUF2935 domain-containing protein n=1 Tax=Ornithinibacillus halotolerans TaxID=1274357 RepID=A0A916RUQ0_9BACI|nr:DUF2935 domain-containing protein [Ornithinibacillus halotolerans]GGA69907.1 hypothetical protein GCM10008025_12350 [Ornithinibacillus halotolerans]
MDYIKSASFEHKFWLQALYNHTQLINDSLHHQEESDILDTNNLLKTFEHLLEESNYLSDRNVIAFTKKAETITERLKEIKLSIIERQLFGSIRIQLSPSIINQMVNEIDEYMFLISFLKEGKVVPVFHELHYHLLWLRTNAIHANTIYTNLHPLEATLRKEFTLIHEQFNSLYLFAVELTGYLRSNVTRFPSLEKFNQQVKEVTHHFLKILQEIDILDTNSSNLLNQITYEIDYYTYKLKNSTNLK